MKSIRNLKNLLIDFSESRARIKRIRRENYKFLKKVRISTKDGIFSNFIKLQTPQQLGVWGKTAFVTTLNPDIELVLNKPNPWVNLRRDIEKNWMLHIEPPGYIRKLNMANPETMKKFGRVYTSDPNLYEKGGKFIASPPYVHWHLALSSYTHNPENKVYDFDFLKSQGVPEKEVSLVTINSKINDLPGHKLRAEFTSRISESNLEYGLYGTENWSTFKQYKGRTLNGKWPIYSKSKYVLAIENEVSDYYWTEKFTDAVLCFCIPIYYGCPRIKEYFPEGSYIPLDITKKSAVDDLRDLLASGFYEKNIPNLLKARELILAKHNMFSFIESEVNKSHSIN